MRIVWLDRAPGNENHDFIISFRYMRRKKNAWISRSISKAWHLLLKWLMILAIKMQIVLQRIFLNLISTIHRKLSRHNNAFNQHIYIYIYIYIYTHLFVIVLKWKYMKDMDYQKIKFCFLEKRADIYTRLVLSIQITFNMLLTCPNYFT